MTDNSQVTCATFDESERQMYDACSTIRYRSEEQKEQDQSVEEEECMPFTMMEDKRKGKYLAAVRDIEAGEIVIAEHPLLVGPHHETVPICLGCYRKVDGSYLCSSCRWPLCGAECESATDHQGECAVFKNSGAFPSIVNYSAISPKYECVMTLRCLLLRETDPKKWELLQSYMSHIEARRNTDLWETNHVHTVEFLQNVCNLKQYDEEMIQNVMGLLDTNTHALYSNGNYFRGFYRYTARLSHDCSANSYCVCHDDMKMVTCACVRITKGTEITISYIPTLQSTQDRRSELKDGWIFDCLCRRCSDPTELGTYMFAMKCPKCKTGNVLSSNSLEEAAHWECDMCDYETEWSDVKNTVDLIKKEGDEIQKGDAEKHEAILRKYEGVLHPNHVLMMRSKRHLILIYGRVSGYTLEELPRSLLERKIALCRDVMAVLDVIEAGLTKIRGMTLYELHAPLLMLANADYEDGGLDKEVFLCRLQEVRGVLAEATTILAFQRETSVEGHVGKMARQILSDLEEWIKLVQMWY